MVYVGCLWGIRTEVVAGEAFPVVTDLQPWDCKSIAKASKVRILHLPPRAKRASDAMKERGLLPLQWRLPAGMIGSVQVAYERARRPLMEAYAGLRHEVTLPMVRCWRRCGSSMTCSGWRR